MDRYQFIWRLRLPHWKFVRLNPQRTDLAYLYDWALSLGFLEVRHWNTKWSLPGALEEEPDRCHWT